MNRFEDLFDAGQPADELETALREMFARREADITEPARPRADGEPPVTLRPPWADRVAELPGGRTGTLLAAAVVALLVLGSVLGVRSLSHHGSPAATQPTPSAPTVSVPAPSPSPTGSPTTPVPGCPLPASWTAALATGAIAVDQPVNAPVTAGPDGSFLMWQAATGPGPGGETDFTHQELAIFDRAGHGTTIWQAADPIHDYVDYSPDSAISADWVVFGLTRPQNLAAHGVAAWNRSTGQLSTVHLLSAAEQNANLVIAFDPIVIGDTAYWIEQKYGDDAPPDIGEPVVAGRPTQHPAGGAGEPAGRGGFRRGIASWPAGHRGRDADRGTRPGRAGVRAGRRHRYLVRLGRDHVALAGHPRRVGAAAELASRVRPEPPTPLRTRRWPPRGSGRSSASPTPMSCTTPATAARCGCRPACSSCWSPAAT